MTEQVNQPDCGKSCGGGCCQQKCEVNCSGDETFGRAELIRRLTEYREQLRAELSSVEQALFELSEGAEALDSQQ